MKTLILVITIFLLTPFLFANELIREVIIDKRGGKIGPIKTGYLSTKSETKGCSTFFKCSGVGTESDEINYIGFEQLKSYDIQFEMEKKFTFIIDNLNNRHFGKMLDTIQYDTDKYLRKIEWKGADNRNIYFKFQVYKIKD